MDIDFVVTWVDPSDPKWRKDFDLYKKEVDDFTHVDIGADRYRDWGLLKYWFRGIEKFAPWVRYVHFITYGHVPSWLDLSNPKIKIVKHEDYIPSQFMPLFNSRPIELMMHKIPDLSEHFVYFNDDFYLTKPISPGYFFKGGKPCDMAVVKDRHTMEGVMLGSVKECMSVINKEFSIWGSIKRHPRLWFRLEYRGFLKLTIKALLSRRIVSLLDTHAPTPYLKSTFETVWEKYPDPLWNSMSQRFRSSKGVNHWIFRYWQILEGIISPCNVFDTTKLFYGVGKNIEEVESVLSGEQYSVVVLNDSSDVEDIDSIVDRVNNAFHSLLPEKSSFEK